MFVKKKLKMNKFYGEEFSIFFFNLKKLCKNNWKRETINLGDSISNKVKDLKLIMNIDKFINNIFEKRNINGFFGTLPVCLDSSNISTLKKKIHKNFDDVGILLKSDGIRFLLFFFMTENKKGQKYYNFLLDRSFNVFSINCKKNKNLYEKTILDGELVYNEETKNHYFQIFDSILLCGEDISEKPYSERLKKLNNKSHILNNQKICDNFTMILKPLLKNKEIEIIYNKIKNYKKNNISIIENVELNNKRNSLSLNNKINNLLKDNSNKRKFEETKNEKEIKKQKTIDIESDKNFEIKIYKNGFLLNGIFYDGLIFIPLSEKYIQNKNNNILKYKELQTVDFIIQISKLNNNINNVEEFIIEFFVTKGKNYHSSKNNDNNIIERKNNCQLNSSFNHSYKKNSFIFNNIEPEKLLLLSKDKISDEKKLVKEIPYLIQKNTLKEIKNLSKIFFQNSLIFKKTIDEQSKFENIYSNLIKLRNPIVECYYNLEMDLWFPICIRKDKSNPNNLNTYKNIINNIKNNINILFVLENYIQ